PERRRIPEAVPRQVHFLAVRLAELFDPVRIRREGVVVDLDELHVVLGEVLLELRHDVRDRALAEEVALPFEDLALVVDVAERALEGTAAPREDLEVVLEAAVVPPELLLREREVVELVLELAHLVPVDDAVLLDPQRGD